MPFSEIGAFWLWVVLVSNFALGAARPATHHAFRGAAESLRELWRVLWGLWRYDKEPESFLSFIESALSRLLRSGFHAAWLRVGHKGNKQQLTFEKYIHAAGDYGIELVFSNDQWAAQVFPKIPAYCDEHGIAFRIETESDKRPREVLRVDCGRDLLAAATLADGLWTEILGLAPHTPRRYNAGAISIFGELVDRPNQVRMSMDEGWRYLHPDEANPSKRTGCIGAIAELYAPLVGLCLVIGTLSSQGEAPEWSRQLAGLTLGGSTESLVLLCLFLFNITVGRLFLPRADQWMDQGAWPPDPPWLQRIVAVWRWVVRVTLPIAVLLVWTGV